MAGTHRVPNNVLKKTIKAIENDLRSGMDKKQIANRHRVNIGMVVKVASNMAMEKYHSDEFTKEKPIIDVSTMYPSMAESIQDSFEEADDNWVINAAIELEEGCDIQEVAKRYNTNIETLENIIDSYRIILPEKEENVEVEEREETIIEMIEKEEEPVRETNGVSFAKQRYIDVGLISGRHDIPVNRYIFNNEINSSNLFDYTIFDETVSRFLETLDYEEDPETGVKYSTCGLNVYVTGLSCALASVIKMCEKYHVNLQLKHFNTDTGLYNTQFIWKKYFPDKLRRSFPGSTYLELVDCELDDIQKSSFYLVTISNSRHESPVNYFVRRFVVKDTQKAWEIYMKCIQNACEMTDKVGVYMDICDIYDGYCRQTNRLAFTYNSKKKEKLL